MAGANSPPTNQQAAEVHPLPMSHDGRNGALQDLPRLPAPSIDALHYQDLLCIELPKAWAASSALSCVLSSLQGHQKRWTGDLRGGATSGRASAACELGLPLPPHLSACWAAGGSEFSQSLSKQLCFIRKAAQIYSFFPRTNLDSKVISILLPICTRWKQRRRI